MNAPSPSAPHLPQSGADAASRALLWPLGLVAVLAALVGPYVYERYFGVPDEAVIGVVMAGCDLHTGPCSARFPSGGALSLAIEPRPVPVVAPLALQVRLDGVEARRVLMDFQGETMNMGFNQVELKRQADGSYAGKGSLPVCVTGRMAWRATVVVEGRGLKLAAPFRFEAGKP